MPVSLIAAVARNGVIGRQGGLPWRLRDDMRYFAETTAGKAVVMGRKTYDSLPERYRPLPGRRNIVVTRDSQWQVEGVEAVGSVEQALVLTAGTDVMVIGGGEIYALALPLASRLYLTEIAAEVEGDVVFPVVDKAGWREMARTPHQEGDWHYDWVVYERV
jgi:dihydrofolate reductase